MVQHNYSQICTLRNFLNTPAKPFFSCTYINGNARNVNLIEIAEIDECINVIIIIYIYKYYDLDLRSFI